MIEVEINEKGELSLVVDGITLEGNIFINSNYRGGGYGVTILDDRAAYRLAPHSISDIPEEIKSITLYAHFKLIQDTQDISQGATIYKDDTGKTNLTLNFYFRPENWKHLWSIREYQIEFRQVFEQMKPPNIIRIPKEHLFLSDVIAPENAIGLSFMVQDTNVTIETEVHKHADILNQLHKLTEASLMAKLRQESVVMHFDFPEEVKVACGQYLLYFAQFLRDLGVEAHTALTHEAGQVLFTVTPEDKEAALDKIRAALDVYLHLPSNPISDEINQSIAVQRLESNILRLRSDLKLAAAEIQAKNATIEAKQLTIDIQKGLLSGEIIFNSMKNVTPQPKDNEKEEFLGGTVALIPIKGKGVEIHLPEIFRRLKQLFKEDK